MPHAKWKNLADGTWYGPEPVLCGKEVLFVFSRRMLTIQFGYLSIWCMLWIFLSRSLKTGHNQEIQQTLACQLKSCWVSEELAVVVRVPRIVRLPIYPSHVIGSHCVAARAANAAVFSFNQLVASANTMDTFSGQVTNTLAIQIEPIYN